MLISSAERSKDVRRWQEGWGKETTVVLVAELKLLHDA